jgi:hypothetical protein
MDRVNLMSVQMFSVPPLSTNDPREMDGIVPVVLKTLDVTIVPGLRYAVDPL